MWLEILFLNPIAWVMWVIIGGSFLSWLYIKIEEILGYLDF